MAEVAGSSVAEVAGSALAELIRSALAELIRSALAELIGSSLAEGAGQVRRIVRCCATCHAGIIRTAAYDVDVPFMQLERHGWDIHAV